MMRLFDNIGSKIKLVAKIDFWVTMVAGWIGAIALIIFAIDDGTGMLIFAALALAALSPILAFLSTMLLYGFGQLIENTEKTPLVPVYPNGKPEEPTWPVWYPGTQK